jgi:D-aminoacyl-tRNA deacylase
VLTPAVSQFTLLASVKKGNKPDFHQSASGDKARSLYQTFYNKIGELYEPQKVKDGVFAAMMDVALVNDGPVCFRLRSVEMLLRKLYPDF